MFRNTSKFIIKPKCAEISENKGKNTYWRLDGKTSLFGTSGTANINNSITRYMYSLEYNEKYTISISWNLNDNTLTTLATLING